MTTPKDDACVHTPLPPAIVLSRGQTEAPSCRLLMLWGALHSKEFGVCLEKKIIRCFLVESLGMLGCRCGHLPPFVSHSFPQEGIGLLSMGQ